MLAAKFGLETVSNASLQQCLTSSRGKIRGEKFLGPNLRHINQNQVQD